MDNQGDLLSAALDESGIGAEDIANAQEHGYRFPFPPHLLSRYYDSFGLPPGTPPNLFPPFTYPSPYASTSQQANSGDSPFPSQMGLGAGRPPPAMLNRGKVSLLQSAQQQYQMLRGAQVQGAAGPRGGLANLESFLSHPYMFAKNGGVGMAPNAHPFFRPPYAGALADLKYPMPSRMPMPQQLPQEPDEGDDEDELGVVETYAEYVPSKLRIGERHPDPVVETASLSSVPPPDVWYNVSIPEETIDRGYLSALQLEAVTYAAQQHEVILPDGNRAGFLIGDGAGVGKGRTLAGIIYDNYLQGRKRAIWLSVSNDLKYDSERDLRDIGAHKIDVYPLNKFKYAKISSKVNNSVKKGVIFSTYSSLIGESQSGGKYRTRLKQLLHWCGDDFDGVIVFDECHRAKNLCPTGAGKPSKTGLAVLDLQQKLPKARVVYASATGASEPRNMAYMVRLGIWGEGTPFPEFSDFISSVEKRGVGAMELVAMDMKLRGMYIARQLSFAGVSFRIEEIPLEESFIDMYDKAVQLWVDARRLFNDAADIMEADSRTKKTMWGQFWGAHQRFFKYLCIASKVPYVIQLAKDAVMNDKCVVIGLQSTGEARTLEALEEAGGELTDFVSTAKGVLQTLIEKHFPAPNRKKTLRLLGLGGSMLDEEDMMPLTSSATTSFSAIANGGDDKKNGGNENGGTRRTTRAARQGAKRYRESSSSGSDSEPEVDQKTRGGGGAAKGGKGKKGGDSSGESSDFEPEDDESAASSSGMSDDNDDDSDSDDDDATEEDGEEDNEDDFNPFGEDDDSDDPWASRKAKSKSKQDSVKAKKSPPKKKKKIKKKKKKKRKDFNPDDVKVPKVEMGGAAAPRALPSGAAEEMAARMKRTLLERLEAIGDKLPFNTLDQLINELGGPDVVAEMTGRKGRVVSAENGSIQYESRSEYDVPLETLNLTEKDRFMQGEKTIAIISEAASSGISLQADRRVKNQKRRVHITLELPWSADRAVQQFGRTHRSNQVNAPEYMFLISDLAGERRFASIVAKRLESLGALTHGDRRAGESRDLSQFNIDNKYGRQALEATMRAIMRMESPMVKPPSDYEGDFFADCRESLVGVGLVIEEETTKYQSLDSQYNNLSKFLNRILGVKVELQNRLFKYFTDTLEAILLEAKKAGRFDLGILDLGTGGDNVVRLRVDYYVRTHATGKATTEMHTVAVERGTSWDAAMDIWRELTGKDEGFYVSNQVRNNRKTAVLAVSDRQSKSKKDKKDKLFRLYRPNTGLQMRQETLTEMKSKYKKVTYDEAEIHWTQQYEASAKTCSHIYWYGTCRKRAMGITCDIGLRTRTYHVLSGSVLAVWAKVEGVLNALSPGHSSSKLQVVRLKTKDGLRIVGTIIPPSCVEHLKSVLADDAEKTTFEDFTTKEADKEAKNKAMKREVKSELSDASDSDTD